MTKTNKASSDKFLSRIIIGFAVVLIAAIAVVVIGNKLNPNYEYEDFTQVGNYQLIGSMPDNTYAVYFYSETCGACKTIKYDTLQFAADNKLNMPLYLLDNAQTQGVRTLVTGPLGQELNATPTIMIFEDNEMTLFIVGAEEIKDFYDDVEAGNFVSN